ncbi:GntR family transcriptional regulator [Aeromicrobium sp. CTD01-1L150]|uniref:GntR family transcriptional regulator n=1 Tax=Aeromicrobium sp. CTD01-1L150 TaxID=3341830 RepID=UPI0035C1EF0D
MPKSRTAGLLDVDHATAHLRELIIDGRLRPGDRLVERTLAETLELSRVPVREALRALVAEGFAIERPTGGVAVRDHDADEVLELLEVSHALDAVAARRMLAEATDVTPLRTVLAEAERAVSDDHHEAAMQANARFHEVLVRTAPAPVVREMTATLRTRLRWLLQQHADPAAIHREHVALTDALQAGDDQRVDALLAQHLLTSRAALEEVR